MEPALPTGQMNAFLGGDTVKINGEARLYRFAPPPDAQAAKSEVPGSGKWWITEDVYVQLSEEARAKSEEKGGDTLSTEFVRVFRERLAVSLDLNDFQYFYRMDIQDQPRGFGQLPGWR